MPDNTKAHNILESLLQKTAHLGASAADAVMVASSDMQAGCRGGKPEAVERAENSGVGLRAWVGKSLASASSTDISLAGLSELAERVVAMARAAPPDPDSTLAPDRLLARTYPELDLADDDEPSADWLMEQARAAEAAALSAPGITNTEGAEASASTSSVSLMTRGAAGHFFGQWRATHASLHAVVLAGEGTKMERDYAFSSARHRADLTDPESIGKEAAERTLKRLNPRRVDTCEVPVVFDPRAARSLVSTFASAINGASVARGTSFLKDAMGKQLFSSNVTIIDDPHIKRGLASKPFDGEGVQNGKRILVDGGVLQSWLLDVRSAAKLKLQTTGHATRSLSGSPSPSSTNLYMAAGKVSPEELIADIDSGFYVTETIGMGVNLVTGDYSQGASGFWIERGKIAYPVSEITIAGHLSDMFLHATPASDLAFHYSTNAPTLMIERMTIAGT